MYTKEEEIALKEKYVANPNLDTVKQLAKEFDKKERSIISKLSAMGCYKRKVYVSKTGKPPERKEDIIERLAKLIEVDVQLIESLEKANKYTLNIMEKKIKELLE